MSEDPKAVADLAADAAGVSIRELADLADPEAAWACGLPAYCLQGRSEA
jgi:hypothetical protein